jgi:hypothetical protein
MVEHLIHIPKIEGSNPATSTEREKNGKNKIKLFMPGSTVVEDLTHNPKVKGSNPATGMVGEKRKQYSAVSL